MSERLVLYLSTETSGVVEHLRPASLDDIREVLRAEGLDVVPATGAGELRVTLPSVESIFGSDIARVYEESVAAVAKETNGHAEGIADVDIVSAPNGSVLLGDMTWLKPGDPCEGVGYFNTDLRHDGAFVRTDGEQVVLQELGRRNRVVVSMATLKRVEKLTDHSPEWTVTPSKLVDAAVRTTPRPGNKPSDRLKALFEAGPVKVHGVGFAAVQWAVELVGQVLDEQEER